MEPGPSSSAALSRNAACWWGGGARHGPRHTPLTPGAPQPGLLSPCLCSRGTPCLPVACPLWCPRGGLAGVWKSLCSFGTDSCQRPCRPLCIHCWAPSRSDKCWQCFGQLLEREPGSGRGWGALSPPVPTHRHPSIHLQGVFVMALSRCAQITDLTAACLQLRSSG